MRQRRLFLEVVAAPLAFAACLALAERALVAQATSRPTMTAANRAFVNGRVFDGQRFVAEPLYVTADGLFSRSRPSGAEVVDLAGGYVIPPFGEGHNHNTRQRAGLDRYLKAGIFYVSNPNSHPSARSTLHPRFNTPSGVDVQLAGGGLTGTGGHPISVVQRNIDRGVWTRGGRRGRVLPRHRLRGRSRQEVAGDPRGPPRLHQDLPPLLRGVRQAARRSQRSSDGRASTRPSCRSSSSAPRTSGLRVAAHVETAADFRAAVRGGVDVVAHLPGFRPPLTSVRSTRTSTHTGSRPRTHGRLRNGASRW